MPARRSWLFAHALFLLSGVSGLGCQSVWTRLFGLGLGQEMPAVLAVVAAFFGGFSLGAWSLDSAIAKSRRPARWYALLEAAIGVWVLASSGVIRVANDLALRWTGLEPSPAWQALVAFGVPFLALLPATAAMGATLPAMERLASVLQPGPNVGSLYAVNTLGAMTGAWLGAFLLVPRLGYANSLTLLAGLNLACALGALLLTGTDARSLPPASSREGAVTNPNDIPPGRLRGLLFATGLLGIGLEVLGVRVLKLVFEDTVFTFACILAVYLLGTALGAGLSRPGAGRGLGRLGVPALLTLLAATVATAGWSMAVSPAAYRGLRAGLPDSLTGVALAETAVAALVFLPPTLVMGATFARLAQAARGSGLGLGRALAWNTLGGALAPVLVGVGLFPLAGAKGTLAMLAAGYLILAWGCTAGRRYLWSCLSLALVFALFPLPDLRLLQLLPGESLRRFEAGSSDSVTVVNTADGHRTLRENHRFTMGGTASVQAERRQAHLPLLLHPAPRRALFLGAGTGITAAAATAHPEVEVDSVELSSAVVAVQPEFAPDNFAPTGRLRTFTADARRFIRATRRRYDVIVADLFHPARDGAGALYTREHFEAIRQRLAPGGLFCQWLPLYQLDEPTFDLIAATFLGSFPDAQVWLLRLNVDTPVLGLVGWADGTMRPPELRPGWLAERASHPEWRAALRAAGLTDDWQFFSLLLATDLRSGLVLTSARLNTDDRPLVSFLAPRSASRMAATEAGTLFGVLRRVPPPLVLDEFTARFRDCLAARNRYLEGLRAEAAGRTREALDAFVDSARLSADFTTGYAHAITQAVQMSKDRPTDARRVLERLAEARPERPVAGELIERLFSRGP